MKHIGIQGMLWRFHVLKIYFKPRGQLFRPRGQLGLYAAATGEHDVVRNIMTSGNRLFPYNLYLASSTYLEK